MHGSTDYEGGQYVTDTGIMDLQYNVLAKPAEGQQSGKQGRLLSPTVTMTIDHKSPPRTDNAVDVSRKGNQNVILTRGNADIMIMGPSWFPVHARTTVKGSSRTTWLANPLPAQPTTIIDETGRGYQVQTETGRAVVKTLDNKLIQDTGKLPEPSEEVQTVLRNA
ncbi:hypothetical protein HY641_03350 [Candidatus Woesearchaeota archaeon]|nr:hypothetical protein [Candidatus Woesearchaeota archaeon]